MRFDQDDPGPGPTESWVTLAGIARETSRIRLGTMVTSMTFRFPGMLAIEVAQVDAMANGRVELGLGAGWFDPEHHAHAVPFPPLGQRFEMLEEQLQIVLGLWTTPTGGRRASAPITPPGANGVLWIACGAIGMRRSCNAPRA